MAKQETHQEKAIRLLKQAINDCQRGDRVDALDSIRGAERVIRDSYGAGHPNFNPPAQLQLPVNDGEKT